MFGADSLNSVPTSPVRPWGWTEQLWSIWHRFRRMRLHHKQHRVLLELDDHLLSDIGASREQARQAAKKTLWTLMMSGRCRRQRTRSEAIGTSALRRPIRHSSPSADGLPRQLERTKFKPWGPADSPLDGSPSKLCATLDLSRRLRMDGNPLPVSSNDLYARLGTAASPLLIDVRRADAFNADDRQIIGASHRLPEDVARGRRHCLKGVRSWLTACTDTRSARNVASALRQAGMQGSLSRRRHRRLEAAGTADAPQARRHGKQMGHARASRRSTASRVRG